MKATEKIWRNGEFIAWDDAKIHVLSHVVSYGSSVFEGIRCYETTSGPAIFRLREHIRRMVDSAKRMEARTMQMEGRIMQHVEGLVDASESRMMHRVDGRIDAAEERLRQHVSAECEKVETKLLTEFHKWGRTADIRTRQTMEANSFMNDRLLNAEDRITTLERSRLPPPATEAA